MMKGALAFAVLLLITMVKGHGKHVRNRAASDVSTEQNDSAVNQEQPKRCSTEEVTDEMIERSKLAIEFYKFKMTREGRGPKDYLAMSRKVVPVCFHVIGDRIARYNLNRNLAALNKAYSGLSCCNATQSWCVPGTCSPDTNIRFVMAKEAGGRLVGTTRSALDLGACVKRNRTDIELANPEGEGVLNMKRAMYVGDARVLNVYFGTLSFSMGYATFPIKYTKRDPSRDGVVVGRDYIVGGRSPRFGEGDTLAHEVG